MLSVSDIQMSKYFRARRIAIACFTLLLAGCSSPGDLVIHQAGDAPMRTTKVTVAGDYGLFLAGDQQPLLQFPLKPGDTIGFERVNDGAVIWLYGISGNARNRLQVEKTYEWRRL